MSGSTIGSSGEVTLGKRKVQKLKTSSDGLILLDAAGDDSYLDPSTSSLAAEVGLCNAAFSASACGTDGTGDHRNSDAKRMILDEYERCLLKHGDKLTDLVRLHQKDGATTKKLATNLEQAIKKEALERKKIEGWNKVVDEFIKGVGDITGRQIGTLTCNRVDALRRTVDDICRQTDEYRKRKDSLDKQLNQLKAQIEQNDAKIEQKKRPDSEMTKLTVQVQEAKNELASVIRSINQSLSLVNNRLHTEYHVDEESDSTTDLRNILDKLLNDVVSAVNEHKKMADTVKELKKKLDDNEQHIDQSKQMNEIMAQEAKKLLLIGNRKEAENIDATDYEAVRKFVEEIFKQLLETLKVQNKELAEVLEEKNQAEHEEQTRKAEMEREIAVKQAKIEASRDSLNKLHAQNEFLRQQLAREQKSPANGDEESEMIRNIKALQEAADKNQNATLEAQLQRSRAQNDEARRHLNELTAAINEAEEKLVRKRQELQEVNEKVEAERETNKQTVTEMERKIQDADQEICLLERQLAERSGKLDEVKALKQECEKLSKTEKDLTAKLQQVDSQLKAIENERSQLTADLTKQVDECNALRTRLKNEDYRRETLEEKLQDIKEKISDTDRKLDREREKACMLERDASRDGAGNYSVAFGRSYGVGASYATSQAFDHFQSRNNGDQNPAATATISEVLDEQIRGLETSRNVSKNQRNLLQRNLDTKTVEEEQSGPNDQKSKSGNNENVTESLTVTVSASTDQAESSSSFDQTSTA